MHMDFKKHLISSKLNIRDALQKLNLLGSDAILFVINDSENLVGSLTDGDVRRGLLKGYTIDDKVIDIIQNSTKYIRKGDGDVKKIIKYRDNQFNIIPVLDKHSDRIVKIINFRTLKSYLPIDVVIMAGGKGKRLRPLTENVPKPLLKVGDKAIIDHNLDRLITYGVDDFWISVNYLGDQIESHFNDRNIEGIEIDFIQEKMPLGTIGAVRNISNFKHEHILITNSDLLTNVDYEKFYLDFLDSGADFSVISIPYKVEIPYAIFENKNRRITGFQEKPTHSFLSNGGIYLMKRNVLDLIPKDSFFNTTDLMDELIALDRNIITYPHNGYWLDIGQMDDYERAQDDIKQIQL